MPEQLSTETVTVHRHGQTVALLLPGGGRVVVHQPEHAETRRETTVHSGGLVTVNVEPVEAEEADRTEHAY